MDEDLLLSPRDVLARVARVLPGSVRERVIVVGSLAAGFHFFGDGRGMTVRTKDADCLLSPRMEAMGAGEALSAELLASGWTYHAVDEFPEAGTRETPPERLPVLRLDPPDRPGWFLEVLEAHAKDDPRERSFDPIETSAGHFALASPEDLAEAHHTCVYGLLSQRPLLPGALLAIGRRFVRWIRGGNHRARSRTCLKVRARGRTEGATGGCTAATADRPRVGARGDRRQRTDSAEWDSREVSRESGRATLGSIVNQPIALHIRDLDPTSPSELDTVTRWAMAAPLESIPELEGRTERALAQWPNFTFDRMRAMFVECLPKPTHRFLVAEDPGRRLVGHSMVFHKLDNEGRRYGYFFTRYVLPEHRRRGVASALMEDALMWFRGKDLSYLQAHTHATNVVLQRLYAQHGFSVVGQRKEPWPVVELRRPG